MVLTVGLAFLLAAVLARGPWTSRTLAGAIGMSWLAVSLVPPAVLVHEALLLVLLVTFPGRSPRGRVRCVLAAAAVPVALLLVPQPAVAVLFAAAALAALPGLRAEPAARLFPVVAGAAVAAVLGASWLTSRLAPSTYDPTVALRAYEVVLLGVAAGFVLASRAVVASRAGLADRLLREDRPTDLSGLAEVLAEVLRDPQLRIIRPDEENSDGAPAGRLEVRDGGRPVAVVRHGSPALDDGVVAAAVVAAVRLVALNQERRREVQEQTEGLRRARDRVMAAADHQRAVTAARLRSEVLDPLVGTAADLRQDTGATGDPLEGDPVEVAVQELDAAVEDIRGLVAGVPPTTLGGGRLRAAVAQLITHCPIPTTLSGVVSADQAVEITLFYVCSEALANVAKHAGATRTEVTLREDEQSVGLSVTDDGGGGADPAGSGLRGLADRLAAHGGRLRVESPPGAGTTVTATIPR